MEQLVPANTKLVATRTDTNDKFTVQQLIASTNYECKETGATSKTGVNKGFQSLLTTLASIQIIIEPKNSNTIRESEMLDLPSSSITVQGSGDKKLHNTLISVFQNQSRHKQKHHLTWQSFSIILSLS